MVTSGCLIEEKGILITIDENLIIKFWSLLNMKCIKSIEINGRSNFKNIFYIKNIYFIKKTHSLAIISKKIKLYKINNINKKDDKTD